MKKNHPIILSFLFLFVAFWVYIDNGIPVYDMLLKKHHNSLLRQNNELSILQRKNKEIEQQLASFNRILPVAAYGAEDKTISTMREYLERTAVKTGVKIRTLGDVQKIEVSEDCKIYETTISMQGSLGEVIDFLNAIYDGVPRGNWRTLSIRPNNQRNPEYLLLDGRMLIIKLPETFHSGGVK